MTSAHSHHPSRRGALTLANTIDRETNSAARTSDAVREPQDVEETDPVNDEQPDGDFDAEEAPEVEDEADESLAVAPVPGADERVVARHGSAGVQVPAALLANPFTRGLAEAYIELRKVTWPTRRDAWNMTIIVIVVSAIMAGLLAATDYGLGHLLAYFVNLGK
jgi:preprotein translocase subunit SecE